MGTNTVILVAVIGLLLFSLILWFFSRYKKCPSDKIMVIYGRVGKNKDGSTRSANVSTAARHSSYLLFRRTSSWTLPLCRSPLTLRTHFPDKTFVLMFPLALP